MPSTLINKLRAFTNPRDERQLRLLESCVSDCEAPRLTDAEQRAMLEVFERFPEEDGFGGFWALLHALEASDGYEPALLQSVRRQPAEFNVLMVQRLLDAGILEVHGVPLMTVLREATQKRLAPPRVKEDVARYIREREAGASEA